MKKPKWARHLTAKQLKHIAETSDTGRASLRALTKNIAHQNATHHVCFECNAIAEKLKLNPQPSPDTRL